MFENNNWNRDSMETRGWEIVKQLNSLIGASGANGEALNCRKLLAEYFKLQVPAPSHLHSAILSCAVKMAMCFPEFHFVPFLEMWGFENLRPEDSEARFADDGKKFPSLAERMTKSYVYSLLFHPEEHLEREIEEILKPSLQKNGYRLEEKDGRLQACSYAIATRVFHSDVRNRKMTFVTLLTPWGDELVAEVHTMIQFSESGRLTNQRLRYEDLTNRMFRIIFRTRSNGSGQASDNGNLRVEAACLCSESIEDVFATSVGYVEHIDTNHRHIHVYDNESRHMVATYSQPVNIKEGDFVRFVPVIPKESNFKSAIITSTIENGADEFGYRNVLVTFVSDNQEYCSWELLPDAGGKVHPIVETNARDVQVPATKGYINKSVIEQKHLQLPKRGDKLQIITFLKRGKDGKKRPFVVWFK